MRGPAAFRGGEGLDVLLDLLPFPVVLEGGAVDAGDGLTGGGAEAAPFLFQRIGDLADGGAQAHRLDGEVEQVALAGLRGVGERIERF
jgi:hypothetical protein